MSLEGFRPISNDRLGSLLSRIRAEAVPFESAPLAKNVRFKARGVQTRNGLSNTATLPSNFKVRGAGVLAQPSENPPLQIPLYLGSDSDSSALYREATAGGGLGGSVSPIVTGLTGDMFMDLATAYNRAFIAYGNMLIGLSDPKQYDGVHYDPISLDPQSSTCTLSQGASGGNVEAGVRYAVVLFLNRHGYVSGVTTAAVSSYTGADGIHKVHVSGIPVSSEVSVTSRIVCFTVAGADQAGPYFYIPEDDVVGSIAITTTIIPDNTTTSIDFNFTDVYLQGTTDITSPQDFFDKMKLPKQSAVYFSPSNRRLIWTGGEDDATIFRVSEADDPETYLESTGFIKPSQNDGERAICAREFRSQLYLFKETAGFLTYNDAANPSDWTVEKRWDRVGPVGPWAVDTSESFMIFLDQSGVYKMDGSIPLCISDEISSVDSRIWSRINFQVKQKFWVFIDTDLDEIHIGVALDGSEEVNRILKCNYLLGFTPGSRKWSMDTIPSTRMLKVLRNLPVCPNPNQMIDPRIAVSQILHLSSNNDGAINLVDPASFVDNGNAIDSKYQTGYHEEEGVLQIGGVGLNARGSGNLQISVLKDQTHRKTITRQLPQEGSLMGEVIKTNGQSPWWALEFSNNNTVGNWFEVTRCDLYVRTIYKTRRTRSTGGSSQSSFSLDSESDSEVDGVSSTNPQLPSDESDCNCDDMPLMLSGLHGDRPLANAQIENTEYIETDRGNAKYFVKYLTPCDITSAVWELVVGKMHGTINSPNQKPGDLGVYDRGFEFESDDFKRIFEWIGSGWDDLPGQTPRSVHEFISNPGSGWQLCDGSVVSITQSNGTTTVVTLPNLLGSYIKNDSSYSGSVIIASSPSLTGTLATAGAHTHPGSTVTGNLPNHTHNVTPTGTIAGSTASNGAHTHSVVATGTVTGNLPEHKHTFVGDGSGGDGMSAVSSARQGSGTGTTWAGPSGTIAGNLPAHQHITSALASTGSALTALGGGWSVSGSIGGTAVVTDHKHALSDLFTTSGFNNQDHHHDDGTLTCNLVYSSNNPAGTTGPSSVLDPISTSITGNTGNESSGHDHDVDFSFFSTDFISGGAPNIDLSGTTFADSSAAHFHSIGNQLSGPIDGGPVAISATFTNTSPDHFHNLEGETGELTETVANGLTFSGSSANTSSDGAHVHGVGTLVFNGDSVVSGGVNSGPIALSLTPTIASDGTHTHGMGTLAITGTGEPQHVVLLPYFKL